MATAWRDRLRHFCLQLWRSPSLQEQTYEERDHSSWQHINSLARLLALQPSKMVQRQALLDIPKRLTEWLNQPAPTDEDFAKIASPDLKVLIEYPGTPPTYQGGSRCRKEDTRCVSGYQIPSSRCYC